ncbi:MAG: TetR/AcrR family transcriptional regulator [Clostridiales bacterium]|nr:TetR/AcrR family transcriptional regulator [Clostridiales bacterium]
MRNEEKKKLNAGRAKSMNKFADALFSLMKKKRFADITITDLSAEAGLVRKTFYRNFETKDSITAYKLDCFFEEIEKNFDFSTAGPMEIYVFCFEYLLKNRDFTIVFTDYGTIPVIIEKIKEYIEAGYSETFHGAASFDPTLSDYYSKFVAVGIASVIKTWVTSGFKQSPAVMAELMYRFLSGVIS